MRKWNSNLITFLLHLGHNSQWSARNRSYNLREISRMVRGLMYYYERVHGTSSSISPTGILENVMAHRNGPAFLDAENYYSCPRSQRTCTANDIGRRATNYTAVIQNDHLVFVRCLFLLLLKIHPLYVQIMKNLGFVSLNFCGYKSFMFNFGFCLFGSEFWFCLFGLRILFVWILFVWFGFCLFVWILFGGLEFPEWRISDKYFFQTLGNSMRAISKYSPTILLTVFKKTQIVKLIFASLRHY